ncbi:hypothetical protein ACFWJT_23310 [Streptomyces sp. NPDC127069]|uniref:hypothetical protein n=1 Tax=Streptomyces sp. NPDC127069 TaxID=3347128 RepID=UPI00365CC4DA
MVGYDYRAEDDGLHKCQHYGAGSSGTERIHDWRSRRAPTVHHAGRYEWTAHAGTDGYANLSWRDTQGATSKWEYPAWHIKREQWTCTALAAPSLTTHDGRLHMIYHA